jgi:hypothetical protein
VRDTERGDHGGPFIVGLADQELDHDTVPPLGVKLSVTPVYPDLVKTKPFQKGAACDVLREDAAREKPCVRAARDQRREHCPPRPFSTNIARHRPRIRDAGRARACAVGERGGEGDNAGGIHGDDDQRA